MSLFFIIVAVSVLQLQISFKEELVSILERVSASEVPEKFQSTCRCTRQMLVANRKISWNNRPGIIPSGLVLLVGRWVGR